MLSLHWGPLLDQCNTIVNHTRIYHKQNDETKQRTRWRSETLILTQDHDGPDQGHGMRETLKIDSVRS